MFFAICSNESVSVLQTLCLLLLSVPSFVAGFGLLKRREWARILTIVLSVFHLVHVPIGTIIGGYSLWALLHEDVRPYFA